MITKNEFKDLFLLLTEFTIPFGKEKTLEPLLPEGWKKDSVGNYYYEIGNSETLFTTHLDTYSTKYEDVVQLEDQDDEFIIFTDGTTILGGDNKLGCCILIGMIEQRIPGTYYFFIGEEPIISGGLWGSTKALEARPEFFKKFKRCVAFDRRGYGSVVIRQKGRMSSSEKFINAIADKLKEFGDIEFDDKSKFGYYTDTAAFMDVIPECTNISAGGFGEHTFKEYVDLSYTYKVFQAALKIDWDSLPVERELETRFIKEPQSIIKKFKKFLQTDSISELTKKMDDLDYVKTREIEKNGIAHLTYSKWLEDKDIDVWIKDNRIYLDNTLSKPVAIKDLLKSIA